MTRIHDDGTVTTEPAPGIEEEEEKKEEEEEHEAEKEEAEAVVPEPATCIYSDLKEREHCASPLRAMRRDSMSPALGVRHSQSTMQRSPSSSSSLCKSPRTHAAKTKSPHSSSAVTIADKENDACNRSMHTKHPNPKSSPACKTPTLSLSAASPSQSQSQSQLLFDQFDQLPVGSRGRGTASKLRPQSLPQMDAKAAQAAPRR